MKKEQTISFWMDAAGRYPLLPKSEVIRLARIIQSQDSVESNRERAIQKIVKHNLRLIPSVVRRCMASKRTMKYGDSITEDLLQVGVTGLRRAAEKYDPSLGYAFSTYAASWIYQAIQRELYNNLSQIRIPENTIREVYNSIDKNKDSSFLNEKPKVKERMFAAFRAMETFSFDQPRFMKKYNGGNLEFHEMFINTRGHTNSHQVNTIDDEFEDLIGLAELTPLQRDILRSYCYETNSVAAIARNFKMKYPSVKNELDQALDALRSVISR